MVTSSVSGEIVGQGLQTVLYKWGSDIIGSAVPSGNNKAACIYYILNSFQSSTYIESKCLRWIKTRQK